MMQELIEICMTSLASLALSAIGTMHELQACQPDFHNAGSDVRWQITPSRIDQWQYEINDIIIHFEGTSRDGGCL